MRSRPLPSIFVAEDDPNDMFLLTRLLKGCGASNPLHLALNGQEAVELLGRIVDGNGLMDEPGIAFLDMRMPRLGGMDVLAWMRERSFFTNVPIVVLSGIDNPDEIDASVRLGAQCFLRKYPSAVVIAEVLTAAARFNERPEPGIFQLAANLQCHRPRIPDALTARRAPQSRT